MQCLQLTRGELPVAIAVTITGSGNSSYCYAIINGTIQKEAGTHEVYSGDTITFGVRGKSSRNPGTVTIDGTKVLSTADTTTHTYDWIVPNGISTVEIAMVYEDRSKGTITVITE